MSSEQGEIERRLGNMIRLGVVSEVKIDPDAEPGKRALCRVSFGSVVSPLVPWSCPRAGGDKTWVHPDIGEQVAFLSPQGDGSDGFVMLMGVYSSKITPPDGAREDAAITEYKDGSRIEVDRKEHVILIKDSFGSAIRMADGYIDLLPAKKVRVMQGGK